MHVAEAPLWRGVGKKRRAVRGVRGVCGGGRAGRKPTAPRRQPKAEAKKSPERSRRPAPTVLPESRATSPVVTPSDHQNRGPLARQRFEGGARRAGAGAPPRAVEHSAGSRPRRTHRLQAHTAAPQRQRCPAPTTLVVGDCYAARASQPFTPVRHLTPWSRARACSSRNLAIWSRLPRSVGTTRPSSCSTASGSSR